MKQANVAVVCTTDDPTDSLECHRRIAADETFDIRVLPTWRPDKGMAAENPGAFNVWVDSLAEVSNVDIAGSSDYFDALRVRHAFFHDMGCRLSDHGLETVYAVDYTPSEVERVFAKVRGGATLDADEVAKFKSAMLYEFVIMDHEKCWTQQHHLGALRDCNTRLRESLGPDVGGDSIGDFEIAQPLARLLDRLDRSNQLCRTALYNLNPRDNALIATMAGNFQDGSVPAKMQFGSGWWFLDQLDGMTARVETLSQMSLLSRFVGMLTGSRSFLSYARHEYFRRLLCNILGNDMMRGVVPGTSVWSAT